MELGPLIKAVTVDLEEGVRVEPSFCSGREHQGSHAAAAGLTCRTAFRLTPLRAPDGSAGPDVAVVLAPQPPPIPAPPRPETPGPGVHEGRSAVSSWLMSWNQKPLSGVLRLMHVFHKVGAQCLVVKGIKGRNKGK